MTIISGEQRPCTVHHFGLIPSQETVSLILLHGWLGSSADWVPLIRELEQRFCIFAIDLPGHGSSRGTLPTSYEESVALLCETVFELPPGGSVWIYGYSLGGRLALGMYHQQVSAQRIFLESAHLGLPSQEEKATRLLVDAQRAQRFRELGLETFLPEWYSLEIFNSLKNTPERREARIQRRLMNPAWGAAEMLLANSLGKQPSPGTLDVEKITLISGTLDAAYTAHYEQASARSLVRHYAVPGAGHTVHEEDPKAIMSLFDSLLQLKTQ